MYFCSGEEDTQCCFFKDQQNQQSRFIKQSEVSNLKARNPKTAQVPQKEMRLICKSSKKQKSQEKTKLSLSKISKRRAASSNRQKEDIKQSIDDPKLVQMRRNKPPNLNSKMQKLLIINDSNPTHYVFREDNLHGIHNGQHQFRSAGHNNYYIHAQKDGANFQQFYLMNQQSAPHAIVHFEQFQERWVPPPTAHSIVRPANHRMIQHHLGHLQLQHVPQNYKQLQPTEFTSRLSTVTHPNKILFKDSGVEERVIKFHSNQPSTKLQTGHLKTVQSIYSEELSIKQQINESVVIIDFFNPSHQIKKQIEANLYGRAQESYIV